MDWFRSKMRSSNEQRPPEGGLCSGVDKAIQTVRRIRRSRFCAWSMKTCNARAAVGASETKAHATRENPGRAVSDMIVLLGAVGSLAAVGIVLVEAGSAKGATQGLLAGFGVVSIALSWFAVHTLFTLRYASLYYTGAEGGIDFNQRLPVRYVDFAYLAFTIGMTFQVSDTDIEKPSIRSTALRHALLSYLLGAVIVASCINLVVGLGSSSGH